MVKTHCSVCGKEFENYGDTFNTMCNDCLDGWHKSISQTTTLPNNVQYGWVCPKCGAVMSPFERMCINCRGNSQHIGITWGSGSGTPIVTQPEV